MDISTPFIPNVDMMVPFNSKAMLLDNIEGCENGQCFIKARTDGPKIHAHPLQEEYLQPISGELEVYLDKKWNKISAGQSIFIPKNAPHTYRNRAETDCIFAYKISPGGSFSEMLKCFEKLSKEKKLVSLKQFSSLLYLARAFKKYKQDVRSVAPPDFVMTMMAGIAKLRGYEV